MEIIQFSEQEIRQFRAATRGTTGRMHFNNAGTSLPPDVVVDTVINYLQEEALYGGYETEDKYRGQLEAVYVSIARLINAEKDEVALVENASFAWGIAFNGIAFEKGDEIITSEMEYTTNLIGFLHAKKMHGVEIRVVPNDASGNFSLGALEEVISPQTKLIAITHIPSGAGNVLPIAEIGKIAGEHRILYLVDACQTVGQIPIDVKEINCDMLSVTGRKFLRGPRGTGFLYVRRSVQDRVTPIFMDGNSVESISQDAFSLRKDARRYELFEKNRALTLGLGRAVDYVLNIGVDRVWQRIQHLAYLLRQRLAGLDGVTVHDKGEQLCGIITFSVKGKDPSFIKEKLAEKQINVSIGKAVSTPIYMENSHLNSTVRASLHYYNTEEEIKVFCEVLAAGDSGK